MATMAASAVKQYTLLVTQGLRAELADRERLVSPALFAATMLVLFSFALGEVDASLKARIYIAETFLTAFLPTSRDLEATAIVITSATSPARSTPA